LFPPPRAAADATVAAATVNNPTAVLEAQIASLREIGTLLRRQLDDVNEDRYRWRAKPSASCYAGRRSDPDGRGCGHWMNCPEDGGREQFKT
jgi:hypothetical protein